MLWHYQTLDVSGSVSCGVWQMACRRVIKVGERAVKELFISQLPCYDLTRVVTELHCSTQIPTKNKVQQTKAEMTVQTHPRVTQHRKSHNEVHATLRVTFCGKHRPRQCRSP